MGWFGKKEEKSEEKSNSEDNSGSDDEETSKSPAVSGAVEVELTRIKSQLEALNEVRKANSEQFTRISEQIGELRGSLMDSNKTIGTIEVASTKAIDLVSSVQPDKLMIEVRRVDSKSEALRANIEANELMMKDVMKELKLMREQMNFYKGVEQVIKLSDEVKQELLEVKKVEGLMSKHADRVETIFIEVEKKFSDFEKFNQAVKELDRSFRKISSDFDKMRVNLEEKSDKKDLVKLVDKFSDFEKHTGNILKLLDQKSKNTVNELNNLFDDLRKQLDSKLHTQLNVKNLSNEEIKETSAEDNKSKTSTTQNSSSNVDSTNQENQNTSSNNEPQKNQSTETKRNIFSFLKK